MSDHQTTQFPLFRQQEVDRLFSLMKAGESASIIGMSGTGKSNLFNHLCDPDVQAVYFDGKGETPIIARVNFHYAPDFSNRSLYSAMLESIELLESETADPMLIWPDTINRISDYHDLLIDAEDDLLKVQRYFKQAIRALMAESPRKLVFLFDQFDEVYQEADERFFANLRGLRESYKYRLVYLTFTRDVLTNLAPLDSAREEFYELLASNLFGLKPYNREDALSLLQRVARRVGLKLEPGMANDLIALTGGHAGLLRAVFLAVAREGFAAKEADLLQAPNVHLEGEKIWQSLSPQEQRVLHRALHNTAVSKDDRPIISQLQVKGVLLDGERVQLFAPLFAAFVATQDPLWERPIHFDPRSRQVLVYGRQADALTKLEYRLFRLLYQRGDELVTKDELINAGWPEARGGVTDEALTAAMARLRKKIESDSANPRFVENVRNQGYKLHLSPSHK